MDTELDLAGQVCFLNPAAKALFPDLEQRGAEHPWLADWDSVVGAAAEEHTKIYSRDVSVRERHYLQTIYYVPETKRIRIYGLDITERKRTEARLAADLAALTRMHALSEKILDAEGLQPLLQEVMDAAVFVVGAQRGTLQLLG